MVSVLLLVTAVACNASVAPSEIQKASAKAIQAPEYSWRLPPPPSAARDTPWIVSVTDRIVASTKSIRDAIGKLLERFFDWLGEKLGGPQPQGGALPSRGLHWTVYLLIAIVVVAGIVMALRILKSRRAKAGRLPTPA